MDEKTRDRRRGLGEWCEGVVGSGYTSRGSYTRSNAVMFKYRIWFYIIPTHSPTHTHMTTLAYTHTHTYTQMRGRACAHSECRLHLFQVARGCLAGGAGHHPRALESIDRFFSGLCRVVSARRTFIFIFFLSPVCKSSHTSVHYTGSCICVPVRVFVRMC